MIKVNSLIKTPYDVIIANGHITTLHYDLHNTDDHSGSDKQQESITLKYDRYWDKPDYSQKVSFQERH